MKTACAFISAECSAPLSLIGRQSLVVRSQGLVLVGQVSVLICQPLVQFLLVRVRLRKLLVVVRQIFVVVELGLVNETLCFFDHSVPVLNTRYHACLGQRVVASRKENAPKTNNGADDRQQHQHPYKPHCSTPLRGTARNISLAVPLSNHKYHFLSRALGVFCKVFPHRKALSKKLKTNLIYFELLLLRRLFSIKSKRHLKLLLVSLLNFIVSFCETSLLHNISIDLLNLFLVYLFSDV